MQRRLRYLSLLCLLTVSPLALGGCPGRDATVDGLASGLSDGIAAFVEDFLVDALSNDG